MNSAAVGRACSVRLDAHRDRARVARAQRAKHVFVGSVVAGAQRSTRRRSARRALGELDRGGALVDLDRRTQLEHFLADGDAQSSSLRDVRDAAADSSGRCRDRRVDSARSASSVCPRRSRRRSRASDRASAPRRLRPRRRMARRSSRERRGSSPGARSRCRDCRSPTRCRRRRGGAHRRPRGRRRSRRDDARASRELVEHARASRRRRPRRSGAARSARACRRCRAAARADVPARRAASVRRERAARVIGHRHQRRFAGCALASSP